MKLSVLIPTNNRSDKIVDCLKSILHGSFRDFEIIVTDQSDDKKTKEKIRSLFLTGVRYFKLNSKGKGKALNFALGKARGEIIVFTDDDCVVEKNWLKEVYGSFKNKPMIMGMTGRIFPYKSDKKMNNLNMFCPATFDNGNRKIMISKTCYHAHNIGFGNNMAFRREVFEKIGNFKEWLGPGSIGLAAIDAEYLIRVLACRYKIIHNPQAIVFHNRWLTKEKFDYQTMYYICGATACYGYFAFGGMSLGRKVVINEFLELFRRLKKGIRLPMFIYYKEDFGKMFNFFKELWFFFRGLILGFWFSFKDPVNFVSGYFGDKDQ